MYIHKLCSLLIVTAIISSGTVAETRILVFGDSLSAAYNIPTEKGWVSLLQTKLIDQDIQFTNASISGETTSGGLVRFGSQIEKSSPHIVVLELGANDGLRGSSLKTMRKNIESMINTSQEHEALILLVGMHIPPNYGRTYTKKFDQIYQDLGKLDQVTLIPFMLEGVAAKAEYIQNDGLHPNEKAQPIIANTIESFLMPLLQN